jgi:hypothetical protein
MPGPRYALAWIAACTAYEGPLLLDLQWKRCYTWYMVVPKLRLLILENILRLDHKYTLKFDQRFLDFPNISSTELNHIWVWVSTDRAPTHGREATTLVDPRHLILNSAIEPRSS